MGTAPSFSVVVTSHNYRDFVIAAIESALAQTLPPLEVVVVDDGSTDGSPQLLAERFGGDARVRLIAQANGGQLAAFAAGIAAARGECIALLDADDLWEPQYLAEIGALYAAEPGVDFVYTNLAFFGAREGIALSGQTPGDLGYSVLLGAYHTSWQGAPTSANSMRRALALRLTQLPPAMLAEWRTRADDCLVCGTDILGGRKYFLDRPLVRYRAHPGNAWLGQGMDATRRYQHWLRVERMLEHYRGMAGVQRGWLVHTKLEFRTKPAPRWRDLRRYQRLLSLADMGFGKRLEYRLALLGHWLKS